MQTFVESNRLSNDLTKPAPFLASLCPQDMKALPTSREGCCDIEVRIESTSTCSLFTADDHAELPLESPLNFFTGVVIGKLLLRFANLPFEAFFFALLEAELLCLSFLHYLDKIMLLKILQIYIYIYVYVIT